MLTAIIVIAKWYFAPLLPLKELAQQLRDGVMHFSSLLCRFIASSSNRRSEERHERFSREVDNERTRRIQDYHQRTVEG